MIKHPYVMELWYLCLSSPYSTLTAIFVNSLLKFIAIAAADGIAEAPTSMSKKEGTIERTWKKTKEGSQLRQLKHSHSSTEDIIRPRETLTEPSSEEVTSSGSSSLSSAKLRKEVSLTREEVNRRVERFIRKFNDD